MTDESAAGGLEVARCRVDRCRGVQGGHHNVQVNTYDFTLSEVGVDLAEVLERAEVRRALSALALDPTNRALRGAADRVLGTSSFFTRQPSVVSERRTAGSSTTSPDTIFGFLFVQNSEAVQVGHHNRQVNYFAYFCSATVDARQLFSDNPELRAAVLDSVQGLRAGDALRVGLGEAIDDAVGATLDVRTLGTVVTMRPGVRAAVSGRDGVSVGYSNRQRNEATVSGSTRAVDDAVRTGERHASRAEDERREAAAHRGAEIARQRAEALAARRRELQAARREAVQTRRRERIEAREARIERRRFAREQRAEVARARREIALCHEAETVIERHHWAAEARTRMSRPCWGERATRPAREQARPRTEAAAHEQGPAPSAARPPAEADQPVPERKVAAEPPFAQRRVYAPASRPSNPIARPTVSRMRTPATPSVPRSSAPTAPTRSRLPGKPTPAVVQRRVPIATPTASRVPASPTSKVPHSSAAIATPTASRVPAPRMH